jgi:hypothetical protein
MSQQQRRLWTQQPMNQQLLDQPGYSASATITCMDANAAFEESTYFEMQTIDATTSVKKARTRAMASPDDKALARGAGAS